MCCLLTVLKMILLPAHHICLVFAPVSILGVLPATPVVLLAHWPQHPGLVTGPHVAAALPRPAPQLHPPVRRACYSLGTGKVEELSSFY